MFQIDLTARSPIYEQVYNKIVELIAKGILKEHEQLPSVRTMAKELGVNPNTIQKAFQELERDGLIYPLTGRGNFIAPIDTSQVTAKALAKYKEATKEAIQIGIDKKQLIQIVEELGI